MKIAAEIHAPAIEKVQTGVYQMHAPVVNGAVQLNNSGRLSLELLNVKIDEDSLMIKRKGGDMDIHVVETVFNPMTRDVEGVQSVPVLAEPVSRLVLARMGEGYLWAPREVNPDLKIVDQANMNRFVNMIVKHSTDKRRLN